MRRLLLALLLTAQAVEAQSDGPPPDAGSPTEQTASAHDVWAGEPPAPDALPPQALRAVEPYQARQVSLDDALFIVASRADLPIQTDGLYERIADVDAPGGPAIDAIATIARRHRLTLYVQDGVLYVEPAPGPPPPDTPQRQPTPPPDAPPAGVSVSTAGEGTPRVSVAVQDAPVLDIVRDLAQQAGLDLVATATAGTRVTAAWEGVSLDDALGLLLLGTPLTHRRDGTTLVVADRQLPGMLTSRLIPLRHIPAPGVAERLPEALRREATVQLVQEQNAILVTAPADIVAATQAFVREIDRPPVQILLEVLVVEFETSGLREAGVSFLGGLLPGDPSTPDLATPGRPAYSFGAGDAQRGGLDVVGDATAASRALNFWTDILGIRSIGPLPPDFYVRLRALEQSGRAEVQSRPHVATLNGNTASISVGTSQYYILKSDARGRGPFGTGGAAERFEYVRADVNLEITPYIIDGADGTPDEVLAVIRPAFATPVGALDPRVPPTIRSWSVDTSVRLRNRESFMLGGLVQQRERVVSNGVPLLSRIPLLGRLFRNTSRRRSSAELVILITPHVLANGRSRLSDRPHLAPRTARDRDTLTPAPPTTDRPQDQGW